MIDWLGRFSDIHGDRYDYSKVVYVSSKNKVEIICLEHGPFFQTPKDHWRGKGCRKCNPGGSRKKTLEEFIKQANEIHGQYDYKEYNGNHNKIRIICPKHGVFEQTPASHLSGKGCPKCGNEKSKNHHLLSQKEFESRADDIHGQYMYGQYDKMQSHIDILCPKHGKFQQLAYVHVGGSGCPKCLSSSLETKIDSYFGNYFVRNVRKVVKNYEFDLLNAEHKFAVECNGLYWHSDIFKSSKYHQEKQSAAIEGGYTLYQFFEHEINNKFAICSSMISNRLKLNNGLFARNCEIVELDAKTERRFFDNNHIQGYRSSTNCYGLIYEDNLVLAMSYSKRDGYWEIMRLCSLIGNYVVGGASKLFKHFILKHDPKRVFTYADYRFGGGGVYLKLGFKEIGKTKPGYFYAKGHKVLSRHQCQKSKLSKFLDNFNSEMSELDNMRINGYNRIYNAGNVRFEWCI